MTPTGLPTAFISHPDCRLHSMGAHHPECPERLDAIHDRLISTGLAAYLQFHEAPLADPTQLERVHPRAYIDQLAEQRPDQGIIHLDPDTAMCPNTWDAALRSAGAGCLATDMVMRGEVASAFCSVRPPGHHATKDRAMGFCFFNNVAVAARHALDVWGLKRVAVIDFDVHHGNGTEDVFANDERVLMVSIFQHPFYPYSGTDNVAPNMCNVPVAAGTRGAEFRTIVSDIWLPRLERFEPQMIFVSAGFDAHYEDDMASLGLLESDYVFVTEQIMQVADRFANGRVVSMLEGGYALSALGRSASLHIKTLARL